MARRRMFSQDVIHTDAFLDLPPGAQNLYFHLGMRADDDGFVPSPKRTAMLIGAAQEDLALLTSSGFLIPFPSGVYAIRDWKINNYIQRDRYTPTVYADELSHLRVNTAGRYEYLDTPCIHDVYKMDTQVREGKLREDQIREGKERQDQERDSKEKHRKKGVNACFAPPTLAEVQSYVAERHSPVNPQEFIDFYAAKGWMVGKTPMKDWKAACRNAETWDRWHRQTTPPPFYDYSNTEDSL